MVTLLFRTKLPLEVNLPCDMPDCTFLARYHWKEGGIYSRLCLFCDALLAINATRNPHEVLVTVDYSLLGDSPKSDLPGGEKYDQIR